MRKKMLLVSAIGDISTCRCRRFRTWVWGERIKRSWACRDRSEGRRSGVKELRELTAVHEMRDWQHLLARFPMVQIAKAGITNKRSYCTKMIYDVNGTYQKKVIVYNDHSPRLNTCNFFLMVWWKLRREKEQTTCEWFMQLNPSRGPCCSQSRTTSILNCFLDVTPQQSCLYLSMKLVH